jgi:hypothetical protein
MEYTPGILLIRGKIKTNANTIMNVMGKELAVLKDSVEVLPDQPKTHTITTTKLQLEAGVMFTTKIKTIFVMETGHVMLQDGAKEFQDDQFVSINN